jgi:hypothetical protein
VGFSGTRTEERAAEGLDEEVVGIDEGLDFGLGRWIGDGEGEFRDAVAVGAGLLEGGADAAVELGDGDFSGWALGAGFALRSLGAFGSGRAARGALLALRSLGAGLALKALLSFGAGFARWALRAFGSGRAARGALFALGACGALLAGVALGTRGALRAGIAVGSSGALESRSAGRAGFALRSLRTGWAT